LPPFAIVALASVNVLGKLVPCAVQTYTFPLAITTSPTL
jgi:hypothetical protein